MIDNYGLYMRPYGAMDVVYLLGTSTLPRASLRIVVKILCKFYVSFITNRLFLQRLAAVSVRDVIAIQIAKR